LVERLVAPGINPPVPDVDHIPVMVPPDTVPDKVAVLLLAQIV
jgi:hypothetical protein